MRTGLGILGLVLVGSCITNMGSPGAVFNAYKAAYAAGDAATLWRLTSPQAQGEIRRAKAQMLATLDHPDPVHRIQLEGQLGVKADDIRSLDGQAFFAWAIKTIYRRLGPAHVRKAVLGMKPLRLAQTDNGVAVVYRDVDNVVRQMPMVRLGGRWLVNETPLSTQSKPEE